MRKRNFQLTFNTHNNFLTFLFCVLMRGLVRHFPFGDFFFVSSWYIRYCSGKNWFFAKHDDDGDRDVNFRCLVSFQWTFARCNKAAREVVFHRGVVRVVHAVDNKGEQMVQLEEM